MLFHITHAVRYEYSRRVTLDPHVLRVRPRADGTQRLIRFHLQVEPKPLGLPECIDLEGNAVAEPWFDGPTNAFAVITSMEVETLRSNPFDFIVPPPCRRLPMVYPEAIRERLAAYTAGAAGGGPVAELARETARAAGGDTVSFLVQLTERLHRECAWTLREEGDPLPPEETLEKRSGSCRDLAVLHAAACAEQGLAARFVTGYHESGRGCGDRYLHAWSEVYIPGGGWRGFDPSRGLAVGEEHVALAASASFRGAAPITGTFRGQGATATMRAEIDIRALRSGAQ